MPDLAAVLCPRTPQRSVPSAAKRRAPLRRFLGGKLTAAAILATIQAAPLLAQETEPATRSRLTGALVPSGAQRLVQPKTVAKTAEVLKTHYQDTAITDVEVLLWQGDYRGEPGAALRKRVGRSLARADGEYSDKAAKDQSAEREVFLCSGKGKRAFLGVWLATEDAAMLVWGAAADPASAPAAAAVGPAATFENVIYTAPKGWKAETAADGVTLTPTDLLPQEQLFVIILQGREFTGDLAAAGAGLWQETCKQFGVEGSPWPSEKGTVQQSLAGWRHFHYYSQVRKGDARLFLDVYFFQVGDRVERVAVLTNFVNRPYDESPARSPKYEALITGFVYGLQFANHRAPELVAPSLAGGDITGVWEGISMGLNGLEGTLELKPFKAVFFDNGMAIYASRLPTAAFALMNAYVEREAAPSRWGTYTFADGKGVLAAPNKQIPMRLQDGKLVLTTNNSEHRFVRLPPVDGARFDGTWVASEWNGVVPALSFTADGHFADDGAVKLLEHSLYSLYSTGDKPGAGTYEVRNYTLLLHYADGREFSAPFADGRYKPGDQRPATLTLGFNDDMLQRR